MIYREGRVGWRVWKRKRVNQILHIKCTGLGCSENNSNRKNRSVTSSPQLPTQSVLFVCSIPQWSIFLEMYAIEFTILYIQYSWSECSCRSQRRFQSQETTLQIKLGLKIKIGWLNRTLIYRAGSPLLQRFDIGRLLGSIIGSAPNILDLSLRNVHYLRKIYIKYT